MPLTDVDCIVIGAGPAGLAAVRALLDGEVGNILVVDRDEAPGGLPQYCRHPGFGWGYTHRLETGPAFVRRMAAVLADPRVTFLPSTTATAICGGPAVDLLGPICGMATVRARAVLVATGIRERPRGAQLVPGQRPERGVLTTGQLQQMVARGVPLPGRRMVVVGTEHVAFSILLTARHAGHRLVGMIEQGERVSSYATLAAAARHLARIPIHLRSRIVNIVGAKQVEAVEIDSNGVRRTIPCDSLVFSGDFVPDAALAQTSGIQLDPRTRGPAIDQFGRTSSEGVFAAGNVLRPVETSGFCAIEGSRIGANIAKHLQRPAVWHAVAATISPSDAVAYVVPQRWAVEAAYDRLVPVSLRAKWQGAGSLSIAVGGTIVWQVASGRHSPHRRIHVPVDSLQNTARTAMEAANELA